MEKILKKLKKLLRLIFGRTTLGTLFLLIQILVLFAGFDWFREYLIYMYGVQMAHNNHCTFQAFFPLFVELTDAYRQPISQKERYLNYSF